MGNLVSNIIFGGPHMMIDRIIVAEPHRIEVGVCGSVGKKDNPYKSQVIRIDDQPLKSLVSFTETNNSIQYNFEENIKLQLIKREDDIIYHLKTDDIDQTGIMHPLVRSHWKTIHLKSEELDKIATFVKSEEVNN